MGLKPAPFNFHGLGLRRSSEARAIRERGPAQKLGCLKALLAFKLNFEQFEPGILGAGNKKAAAFDMDLTGLGRGGSCKGGSVRDAHAVNDQLPACKRSESAGPGLKAAPAVLQLRCRARGKVHAPVFASSSGAKLTPAGVCGLG